MADVVTKNQLIDALAEKLGYTKSATHGVVDGLLELIVQEVANGNRVVISGFGAFSKVEREAREVRSPRSGEMVPVPAKSAPKFQFGKAFKDSVNR